MLWRLTLVALLAASLALPASPPLLASQAPARCSCGPGGSCCRPAKGGVAAHCGARCHGTCAMSKVPAAPGPALVGPVHGERLGIDPGATLLGGPRVRDERPAEAAVPRRSLPRQPPTPPPRSHPARS